jgi:predicted membrane channel-forming protein YqfA (hemolysin III family)
LIGDVEAAAIARKEREFHRSYERRNAIIFIVVAVVALIAAAVLLVVGLVGMSDHPPESFYGKGDVSGAALRFVVYGAMAFVVAIASSARAWRFWRGRETPADTDEKVARF